MSKYFFDGKEYETSLKGLVIWGDTDEEHIVILQPTDKNWKRYFEANPEWADPSCGRAIILYAYEDNLNEVDHVTYITWKDHNPYCSDGEHEIQLDPIDRAYINGLLTQKNRRYDSVVFID